MDDINAYQLNPQYILISLHLKKIDKEFRRIIQEHSFIDTKNSERLIQEYLNKLYCTLYSLEYCLERKDSLTISLISKYVYEIFIDFFYIFGNSSFEEERVEKFFDFEKNPEKNDWTDARRSARVTAISSEFLRTHRAYYSRLNNNAHPSIHSLFLNRMGMEFEQWVIFSSILMNISTIILILTDQNTLEYFKFDKRNLNELSKANLELLRSLSIPIEK